MRRCGGRLLHEFNLEIGAGLGELAGKQWRIGLMGHASSRVNVQQCSDRPWDTCWGINPHSQMSRVRFGHSGRRKTCPSVEARRGGKPSLTRPVRDPHSTYTRPRRDLDGPIGAQRLAQGTW